MNSKSANRVKKHRAKKNIKKQYENFLLQEKETSDDQVSNEVPSLEGTNFECDLMSIDNSEHQTNQSNVMIDDQEYDVYVIDSSSSNYEESVVDDEEFSVHDEGGDSEVLAETESIEIGQLRKWSIENHIPQKALDGLLKILNQRLLPELPETSKTFLKTSSSKYIVESMIGGDDCEGEFTYLSILEGLKVCLNPDLHKNNLIKLDFNIDGVKIKKPSPKTLWPILCRVLYEPDPYVYKPFPVAVFYGKSKPKNVTEFLEKFILEINLLQTNGASIDVELYEIQIRSFICDIPAKSFIKCTKGHTSFNGCERCDTVASKVDSTTVYLETGDKRTGSDFINFNDASHHNEVCPLIAISPPIDLVDIFVIDAMHLLYLGVNFRILDEWMKKGSTSPVKISPTQKKELNRRTMIGKPLSTDFFYFTVVRLFYLILLEMTFGTTIYFFILHVDYYQDAVKFATIAQDYLTQFISESKVLYSPTFITLNVHYLNHIADDVKNMKSNINDMSAFPFENELGKIKKILRSPHHTLAQYCRRIHEEREILELKAKLPADLIIIKERKTIGLISIKYQQQFLSIKHPNNTVLLKNKSVVKIIEMFHNDNSVILKVVKYKGKSSAFKQPCDSAFLDIYEISDQVSMKTEKCVPLSSIEVKMVKLSIESTEGNEKKTIVIPLLH
ncbi:hypothetical protein TKK_0014852 [Trichogramma kaykai]